MPAPTAPAASFAPTSVNTISVAQMGQPQGIVLSGGQLQGGTRFTLPVDQVVTNAQLLLNLKFLRRWPRATPPATDAQRAAAWHGAAGRGRKDVSRFQLDIPSALMVSSNNLSFKINDGDAMQCQRDLTDKYRVTVLPDSRFELEGQQLDIGADLSHFPRPFFDSMQMTPADIAFAFGAGLSSDTLSAAALISSWLGIQADYRGVSFAALNDTLPEKNGILIGHPGEKIGGMTLPQTTQPLLQIVDNPANPVYKLLLVVGKDDAALRTAAWRLTRGNLRCKLPASRCRYKRSR
jgi:hypothetical protein